MKKCDCETCKLSRRIQAARAAKDVPALVACMTEVWGRMEAAEADLAREKQETEFELCHHCLGVSGVYYSLCDDCMTKFNRLEQSGQAGQGAEKDAESANKV